MLVNHSVYCTVINYDLYIVVLYYEYIYKYNILWEYDDYIII